MDCAKFEALLFDGLDASLEPLERERMSRHEQGCAQCRDLAALVAGTPEPASTAPPAGFAAAVLMHTSGKACAQAESLLAGVHDESPGADELLRLHLRTCADCAALERALTQLRRELPVLAATEPDAHFLSSVLAATLGARVQATTAAAMPTPAPRIDLAGLWQRLARRPRLALEASYAIAMLALLVFGLPSRSTAESPVLSLDAWWREWSATAATALDSRAQDVWDTVLTPHSENLWSLWNKNAAGDVEPDTRRNQ